MKLAMYQLKADDCSAKNLEKALAAIKEAAENGADMIAFPEIQLTKFMPQYEGGTMESMEITDPAVKAMQEACKENRIWAVPNIYLRENGHNYDTSIVINREGEIIGKQKMVHIAQAVQFYEQDYYTPSDEGFPIIPTEFGNLGLVICFDRHYPESIRTEALKGADYIIIPTANTKSEPSDVFEWEIKIQAFQSSVAIAMANRVGLEDQMDFAGESIVVDPYGKTLLKADDREGLVYCEFDPMDSRVVRKLKPYTQLRRTELYE